MKVTMPEPVAYQDDDGSCWELTSHPELMTPLITTTQAEAYADARVREVLEEAINLLSHGPAPHHPDRKHRIEIGKDARQAYGAAIRALIPKIIREALSGRRARP